MIKRLRGQLEHAEKLHDTARDKCTMNYDRRAELAYLQIIANALVELATRGLLEES